MNQCRQPPYRVRLAAVAEPVAEVPVVDAPESDRTAELIETVAPVVRALVDPVATQSVEVLEAKIRNQRALMAKTPEPIKTIYRNNVAKLEAKLAVARRRELRDADTRRSAKEWSTLGKTLAAVGIAVGIAAAFSISSVGSYYRRKEAA